MWPRRASRAVTGGDPITANFMRQDPFTYPPQFKLAIARQSQTKFLRNSPSMRLSARASILTPFTVTIPLYER